MSRCLTSVGTIHTTKHSGKLVVTEVVDGKTVNVRFTETGTIKTTPRQSVLQGSVKDPLFPNVEGVGFLGVGPYKTRYNGKITKAYSVWRSMMNRCYGDGGCNTHKAYFDCSVHPDWHNFQEFAMWFENNHIEGFELDKDLIFQGNRLYNPYTCVFLHKVVNGFLASCKGSRGKYPIGCSYNKEHGLFESSGHDPINNKKKRLGYFKTPEECNSAWIKYKKQMSLSLIENGYLVCDRTKHALLIRDWSLIE